MSIVTVLEDHTEKELPKVQSEIGRVSANTREQLEVLGTPRSNIAEQRLFLSELASAFYRGGSVCATGSPVSLRRRNGPSITESEHTSVV